jgi:hypothetical protein
MDLMCDDEGCLTRVGDNAGDIVAWDNVHLTVAGSLYLVDRFLQALSDGPAPSQQPELGQNLMSIRQRGDPADDQ